MSDDDDDDDYGYTCGNHNVSHREHIDNGGFGEVHKVYNFRKIG